MSAPHRDEQTTPAAAQEPPWLVATRQIRYFLDAPNLDVESFIKTACEQHAKEHAAALAQENNELREAMSKCRTSQLFCDLEAANKELSALAREPWKTEADAKLAAMEVALALLAQERDNLQAALDTANAHNAEVVNRLTAERDKAIAALNKIASWKEGATVTGSFDEPHSARIARAALSSALDLCPVSGLDVRLCLCPKCFADRASSAPEREAP